MTKLVKLPKTRYGAEGSWINPDMVIRVYQDQSSVPAHRELPFEPITVVYMMGDWKLEFEGHRQDALAKIINESRPSFS